MFVMLRLLGGMQSPVLRFVTDGEEAGHSSTDGDSECSNDYQHNVWNPLLCMVGHYFIGPLVQESLTDESLVSLVLCCHFSVDLLCMGFYDVGHDVSCG